MEEKQLLTSVLRLLLCTHTRVHRFLSCAHLHRHTYIYIYTHAHIGTYASFLSVCLNSLCARNYLIKTSLLRKHILRSLHSVCAKRLSTTEASQLHITFSSVSIGCPGNPVNSDATLFIRIIPTARADTAGKDVNSKCV